MNKLSVVGLAVISSIGITHTAHSETNIPEVVITAKGNQTLANVLPTSHVFTLADIEVAQAKDVPALLDRIAGISVRDSGGRGSTTGVFIRGVASSQIIVLIDGVRVGSATLGSAALNSYPIELIERVEVVKGPLSGIYGADAVGGVIQLFTKKGGNGLGSVRLGVGSDGLVEGGISINGGNERNGFTINAFGEDTDGVDSTSILTDGNGDKDSYEEKALSFAGKAALSDRTNSELSVIYSDSTVEFDNLFGTDGGLFTDTKTVNSALNVTSLLSDSLRWTNALGINKDESVTPAPSEFPSDITTDRDSFSSELAINLNTDTVLTVGADYYEEDITTLADFPTTDRDNKGVFTQVQSSMGAFGLVGSLRYDDNSAYGTNTNGSLALNYDLNDSTRAVVSYGTAFVAPSFNFLYFPFFGNPDLLPEESESFEVSLLGQTSQLQWRVSAYKTDIENLFSFDPDTFLAANVGEAELKGLEIEITTEIAQWDVSLNLDLLSTEDKLTGIELDDRAERTVNVSAERDFGAFDVRFDLKGESDRFDNRGTELSSYGLFDISGSYQFNDQIKLYANIDNVFDKDYTVNLIGESERFNTEGRQAKLTLQYNF